MRFKFSDLKFVTIQPLVIFKAVPVKCTEKKRTEQAVVSKISKIHLITYFQIPFLGNEEVSRTHGAMNVANLG